MTVRVKADRSSAFRNNMECRHCKSREDESQKHSDICTGTTHERRGLTSIRIPKEN